MSSFIEKFCSRLTRHQPVCGSHSMITLSNNTTVSWYDCYNTFCYISLHVIIHQLYFINSCMTNSQLVRYGATELCHFSKSDGYGSFNFLTLTVQNFNFKFNISLSSLTERQKCSSLIYQLTSSEQQQKVQVERCLILLKKSWSISLTFH